MSNILSKSFLILFFFNYRVGQNNESIEDQYRELFLFALLTFRHDTAKYFWEKGEDIEKISAALVACNIYRGVARKTRGELKEYLNDIARYIVKIRLIQFYNKD